MEKSDHPTVVLIVWASIRVDNNGPPLSNGKSIAAICEGEFSMGKEGAENRVASSDMNVEDYARVEQSGTVDGGEV